MSVALTKSELIQKFSAMDTAVLQKLHKYSEYLIIPDENVLVNATMTQMVDEAHNLANSLFPEWTDRSKSDFGQFLLELMAVFSEKDFWYINAFANEGILRKMRSYSNAFSRASSMGYIPTVCTSASASFSVTFIAGDSVDYIAGDLIVSAGGKQFTNDDTISLPQSAANMLVPVMLYEGERFIEDVSYNGYNVYIRKKNIDINSIRVVIGNVYYTRVRNFGLSAKDSTHYLVLPEEDGSISIYFGSNNFGTSPEIGQYVRVEYRTSSGSEGNMEKQGEGTVADSLSERKAVYAAMTSSDGATGGTDAETLTSIKETAPLYFNTKRAIINSKIGEDTLNSFPFIHRSKIAYLGGYVTYRAIPISGEEQLLATEIQYLVDNFEPYVVMGFEPSLAENSYVNLVDRIDPLGFTITVRVSVGTNLTSARTSVEQVLTDITSPLISAEYGSGFNLATTEFLIRSVVSGVRTIVITKSDGSPVSDVSIEPIQIFQPVDLSKVTIDIRNT